MIADRFAALRAKGRKALVPYITAGYPDFARTVELLRGLEQAGADVIELGLPFSDPMADGPVIQASSQAALAAGMTFDRLLEAASQAKVGVPLVIMTYLNPILAAGPDALTRAAEAGIHGLLVSDLPVGADPRQEERLGQGPLAFIRLVAPTTPDERMREIANHGSGFVYLISRLGVTGDKQGVSSDLPKTIERLRIVTRLPICVGFGIAGPEQAASVARVADGVVVGSAVVRASGESVEKAVALVSAMRKAIDAAS